MKNRFLPAVLVALAFFTLSRASHAADAPPPPPPPNIVFILADDMGYGDPKCFNPDSRIPTPNIDRLASQGMRFTDAHAPGSVCVPSRYGLLTGRYPFRNKGIKDPSNGPLIEKGRQTIATVLHDRGYATAMIGKWHLGFDGGDKFVEGRPLRGGPIDHGFDTFFGQHASLDIPPYFYIDQDRYVQFPTDSIGASRSPDWSSIQGVFWRSGKIAPAYKHVEVLPTYTRKAVEFLESRAKPGASAIKPFFLYVALTAPHTPWVPMEQYRGKSMGGLYGDFVTQVDDAVGQILDALDRAEQLKNTLVFFASDNGPVWYPADVTKFGHSAAGPWRGMKGDAWEAGHRMPFIARWPGKIAPGSASDQTICFTDMMATFASAAGKPLADDTGDDSYDLMPLLMGHPATGPLREATITESSRGVLALRAGNWKLIPALGSGGFTTPAVVRPRPGDPAGQLYDLADDPGETKNLYADQPKVVARLTALLARYRTTSSIELAKRR